MLALIDKKLLELLYNQGYLELHQVIEIIDEHTSDKNYWKKLNIGEASQYGEATIVELQRRFRENVECELFSTESNDGRMIISPDAIWVFSQIMQEEYDENGEVVALVLPNFDMEGFI